MKIRPVKCELFPADRHDKSNSGRSQFRESAPKLTASPLQILNV